MMIRECSICMIELEDEDAAMQAHGNITHCPECGRPLTERSNTDSAE